ncbi:MAG: LysE family transporter [Pseudomonadota bacterium]
MEVALFFRGVIIGLSIAAPVGPIGVLCIRRTLTDGCPYGIVSGLGAATADAIYGATAGFGLTLVSSILISRLEWLRIIGGIFLCYLGVKTLSSRPAGQSNAGEAQSLAGAYASTFFLTLTNPMTILSFGAVFAGLGLGCEGGDYVSAGVTVLGVFVGSASWWLILTCGIGIFREKFDHRARIWVNRISGAIIASFGLIALIRP